MICSEVVSDRAEIAASAYHGQNSPPLEKMVSSGDPFRPSVAEDASVDLNGTTGDPSNSESDEGGSGGLRVQTPRTRHKRKNFQPRNIVYHYADEEESVNGGGPMDDEEDDEDDFSGSDDGPESSRQSSPVPDRLPGSEQPLDLSDRPARKSPTREGASSPVDLSRHGDVSSSTCAVDLSRSIGGRSVLGPEGPFFHPHVGGPEASALKDYAESTMKELLSIYGFNDATAESLTKGVPLHKFSSGKILENMTHSSLPGCLLPPGFLPQGYEQFSSVPVEPGHRSSGEGEAGQASPRVSDSLPLPAEGLPDGPRLSAGEGPSGHQQQISGPSSMHPRVMFPPTMAQTILTLAALGSKASPGSLLSSSPCTTTGSLLGPGNLVSAAGAFAEQNGFDVHGVVPSQALATCTKVLEAAKPPLDYSRYVKRFSNANECGSNYCKDLNYREHFHCVDCNSRVFVKKEEMIRHFKWHKKRDESLQHGFMRYSPMDDCSDKFPGCSHNRKQTHYHCLKEGCDKVYISTSDVQMHANYHRKDSAIIQEGFQRYRATENCATAACAFFGQRTTHFHCRRQGCSYTFKNKADMEKHKSYHIKDEQLNKDGFKKFMKHEHCTFDNCRFSRICNHIHCIRPGCSYVLHSSGQLYSHKRKHERCDNELAYRKFKLAQSMIKTLTETGGMNAFFPDQCFAGDSSSSPSASNSNAVGFVSPASMGGAQQGPGGMTSHLNSQLSQSQACSSSVLSTPEVKEEMSGAESSSRPLRESPLNFGKFTDLLAGVKTNMPFSFGSFPGLQGSSLAENMTSSSSSVEDRASNLWKKYLRWHTDCDSCRPHCEYQYKDHYHCMTDNCDLAFRAKDIAGVQEHARNHEQQEQITEAFFTTSGDPKSGEPGCSPECPLRDREHHYHCAWEGCCEVISSLDKPFRRLDHYKIHEYSQKLLSSQQDHGGHYVHSLSPGDGFFKRKRGRPPKNRMIEFPMSSSTPTQSPQAVYTSFKLPKPGMGGGSLLSPTYPFPYGAPPLVGGSTSLLLPKVSSGQSAMTMVSTSPMAVLQSPAQGKAILDGPVAADLYGSDQVAKAMQHSMVTNMTVKPEVQEGFNVYPEKMACPDSLCQFLGQHHFHCMQPLCFYVTDRSDILLLHSKDFHDNIDIMEGFAFFDRSVDCRLPGCHSNKVNRHFHCTRPHCNYSFVRYSTMSMHEQKHRDSTSVSPPPGGAVKKPRSEPEERPPVSPPPETPPKTTVVKAAGTFYPLSAFTPPSGQSVKLEPSENSEEYTNGQSGTRQGQGSPESTGDAAGEQPLTKLLQQSVVRSPGKGNNSFQGTEKHIQYGPVQSCGRPFCKLKRKEHFHCNICNQAFSSFSRLKPHIAKHSESLSPVPIYGSVFGSPSHSGQSSPGSSHAREEGDEAEGEEPEDLEEDDASEPEPAENDPPEDMCLSSPGQPNRNNNGVAAVPKEGSYQSFLTWMPLVSNSALPPQLTMAPPLYSPVVSFPSSPVSELKLSTAVSPVTSTSTYSVDSFLPLNFAKDIGDNGAPSQKRSFPLPGSLDYPLEKKMKIPSLRLVKDEPVPAGYIRYRFNEDCQYPHCGYREHQTHFHCMRKDCGYSFCDKTRFVQHTARHERLDTLMGGDFQQFRANVNCGRGDCLYATTLGAMANKASHFHCLKCDFVCTDTNKVVAHRRQHAKMDSIYAAGFEKFTPSQNCNVENCNHNQRQTHYHCLKCQYIVLGLSQMSSHKYRHME